MYVVEGAVGPGPVFGFYVIDLESDIVRNPEVISKNGLEFAIT